MKWSRNFSAFCAQIHFYWSFIFTFFFFTVICCLWVVMFITNWCCFYNLSSCNSWKTIIREILCKVICVMNHRRNHHHHEKLVCAWMTPKNKSNENYCIHICWRSSVEYFLSSFRSVCEMPVLWLSRNSCKISHCRNVVNSRTLTQPLPAEVMTHLVLSRFPYCDVTWTLPLLECMQTLVTLMDITWVLKRDITVGEQPLGSEVWGAITLVNFSLVVCLVMLFVDECLDVWKPCDVMYTIPLTGCWKSLSPNKTISALWNIWYCVKACFGG